MYDENYILYYTLLDYYYSNLVMLCYLNTSLSELYEIMNILW